MKKDCKILYCSITIYPERVVTVVPQHFTTWEKFKFWVRDIIPFVGLAFSWAMYAAFMVVLFKL